MLYFDLFRLSLMFHILGLVMWLGSLLVVTRLLAAAAKAESSAAGKAILSRVFLAWTLPGAVLVLVSGFVQLSLKTEILKQAWFHAKAGLLLLLLTVTVMAWSAVRKGARGESVSAGAAMGLHGSSGLLLILVLMFTLLGVRG